MIISVGREILRGRVLDSNSNFIARQLTGLGHDVIRIVQVDDRIEDIIWEVKFSSAAGATAIITTGGLGPTQDDITIKAIASTYDTPCKKNPQALKIVEERYKFFYDQGAVSSPQLTPERRKMACFPLGAEPLYNGVGAAPGMKWKRGGLVIYSLPGVPSEMKYIFENSVKPDFVGDYIYEEEFFDTPCRDESVLGRYIKEFLKTHPEIYLKSVPVTFGKNIKIQTVIGVTARSEEIGAIRKKLIEEFLASIKEPC